MKRQLLGLLGAATVAVVQATTPCANSTVLDIISTNMTLGMDLLANATTQIQASSCNGTAISCSVNETDVVSILSDLYSGLYYLYRAIEEYSSITGLRPPPCPSVSSVCNCPQIPTDWAATESLYNLIYLPTWNSFVIGNVINCTFEAKKLFALASKIYCDSQIIAANYEACRYDCGLPCCDDAFALQVNTTFNAAVALIGDAYNANEASCTSGTYSCTGSNTYQTIQDLEAANALLSQLIDQMEGLYGIQYISPGPCSLTPGMCSCITNGNAFSIIDDAISYFQINFQSFVSGDTFRCGVGIDSILFSLTSIQCRILQLILNYNECLKECSCPPSDIQTGITESMNQALSYIDNVWTAYNAQCPGRFNCSSTNLTLVQEDLTQAVAFYDLAIGNYTEFIQDTGFNATCSPLRAECGCRLIGDELKSLNATYYLDYLPLWGAFIAGYTANCTAQAELLRTLVLEQKCIAEQLNVDYGKCYENCQTNWCLYYNCNSTCKPSVTSTWTPPKPSRLLRYRLL